MSVGVYFTPAAYADLRSQQDYIADHRPQASIAWVDRLAEKCHLLGTNPGWGRPREDLRPGLRSLPFERCLIYYRVTARGVEIVRILHMARDQRRALNSDTPEEL